MGYYHVLKYPNSLIVDATTFETTLGQIYFWLHKAFSIKVSCYDKCYGQCYLSLQKGRYIDEFL